jgi:hypothetical protein
LYSAVQVGQVLHLAEAPLGVVDFIGAEVALQDGGERRTFGVYGVSPPTWPRAPAASTG